MIHFSTIQNCSMSMYSTLNERYILIYCSNLHDEHMIYRRKFASITQLYKYNRNIIDIL